MAPRRNVHPHPALARRTTQSLWSPAMFQSWPALMLRANLRSSSINLSRSCEDACDNVSKPAPALFPRGQRGRSSGLRALGCRLASAWHFQRGSVDTARWCRECPTGQFLVLGEIVMLGKKSDQLTPRMRRWHHTRKIWTFLASSLRMVQFSKPYSNP